MALLRGRARLGALTLAYPHTPPFLSWGRSCAGAQGRFASAQRQERQRDWGSLFWGEDMPQMAGGTLPAPCATPVRCVRRGGERRGPASDRQIDQQVSRSDDGYFLIIPYLGWSKSRTLWWVKISLPAGPRSFAGVVYCTVLLGSTNTLNVNM
eukprot:COSAG01_NODE_49_length_31891_cov_29.945773_17_plen_153_part_00